jgi:hypothetical protein
MFPDRFFDNIILELRPLRLIHARNIQFREKDKTMIDPIFTTKYEHGNDRNLELDCQGVNYWEC